MNKDIICFYRANEYYGCFSNWYETTFTYAGIEYSSTEQYMMYQKAIIFKDYVTANKILNETNLDEIKKLGKSVTPYNDQIWDSVRRQVMRRGIRAKFAQNHDILQILLNTKDSILAEAAPKDLIWGIGLSKNNPNINDVSKWPGRNLLGDILMQVREELRHWQDCSVNNVIEYHDFTNLPYTKLWKTPINELLKIKELQPSINAYLDVVDPVFKHNDFLNQSFADIESQTRNPYHGACLAETCRELKQDIYEMDIYGMINTDSDNNVKDILSFVEYWLDRFDSHYSKIENKLYKDMTRLNFKMDCGESARIKYPHLDILNNNKHLMSIIDKENDINFLTTLLYSKYRYITHWTSTTIFDETNMHWLLLVLKRIKELC